MGGKIALVIINLFVFSSSLLCQDLKSCTLTAAEKKEGVLKKFQFDSNMGHHVTSLILYANHSFFYETKSFAYNVFSDGSWSEKNNQIILNSHFQSDNLPIKILYKYDSSGNDRKIAIAENLKQIKVHDALIYINNDSVNCFPDMDCPDVVKNKNIDSLRVTVNDVGSPWVKILRNDYKELLIILQTELNLTKYVVFKNKRYSFEKTFLKQIE